MDIKNFSLHEWMAQKKSFAEVWMLFTHAVWIQLSVFQLMEAITKKYEISTFSYCS